MEIPRAHYRSSNLVGGCSHRSIPPLQGVTAPWHSLQLSIFASRTCVIDDWLGLRRKQRRKRPGRARLRPGLTLNPMFTYCDSVTPKAKRETHRRQVTLEKFDELRSAGHTIAAAAERVGYSESTIYRLLRRRRTRSGLAALVPDFARAGRRSSLRDSLTHEIIQRVERLAIEQRSSRKAWLKFALKDPLCPAPIREALAAGDGLPYPLARAVRLERIPAVVHSTRSKISGIHIPGFAPIVIAPDASGSLTTRAAKRMGISSVAIHNLEVLSVDCGDVGRAVRTLARKWPSLISDRIRTLANRKDEAFLARLADVVKLRTRRVTALRSASGLISVVTSKHCHHIIEPAASKSQPPQTRTIVE